MSTEGVLRARVYKYENPRRTVARRICLDGTSLELKLSLTCARSVAKNPV